MKSEKVVFIDEGLAKSFEELSNKEPIKKALIKVINNLKENAFCGRNVKKKLIPKDLIEKYGIDNLWIYNLPSAWRVLYSVTPSADVKIIAAILDWMSHKDYEKLFKFT